MDKKKFLISSFFVLFILFNVFHSGKQIVRRRFLVSDEEPDNINIESEEEKPSTYPYTDINFWISLLIASCIDSIYISAHFDGCDMFWDDGGISLN